MTQSLARPVLVKSGILWLALFSVDLAFTNGASSQKRTAAKPSGISVADLFSNNCARCHGADGAGETPLGQTYNTPDFTDPEWWRKNSKITSTQSLVFDREPRQGWHAGLSKETNRHRDSSPGRLCAEVQES